MTLIAELMIEWCTKHEWIPMSNTQPKLIFEKIESYSLALSYRHNAYTQDNRKAIDLVTAWCTENSCGINDTLQELFIFRSEREMVWFMLRWT